MIAQKLLAWNRIAGQQAERDARQGISPVVWEHWRNPHNFGPMPGADAHAEATGDCGDSMGFWLRVRGERVVRVHFVTDGCMNSVACGSMAATLAEGRTMEEVADLDHQAILGALGGVAAGDEHCATLATGTLHLAVDDYFHQRSRIRASN